MVTEDDGTERWRWENDPFGRNMPVEFGVSEQDVDPDDDSSSGEPAEYNTCCCDTCGGGTCNNDTSGCSSGCCDGESSQDVVWSKTYTVSGAQDMRLHFSAFDVADGTSRTSKDYVELMDPNDTVFATLTGDLGAHWSPWVSESESGDYHTIKVELVADNVQDGTRGVVVDKLEYVDENEVRFVLDLRMPGQIWDEDAHASYNFHRWYRSEDGRYLSPDPIGLAGGEPGYFGYVSSNPLGSADPSGLDDGACEYPQSYEHHAEHDDDCLFPGQIYCVHKRTGDGHCEYLPRPDPSDFSSPTPGSGGGWPPIGNNPLAPRCPEIIQCKSGLCSRSGPAKPIGKCTGPLCPEDWSNVLGTKACPYDCPDGRGIVVLTRFRLGHIKICPGAPVPVPEPRWPWW